MLTEDDVRVAFREMERLTPDTADIIGAVYDSPRRPARSWWLSMGGSRRHALRASVAVAAAGALAAAMVIAAVAHDPATKAASLAAPTLRAHLLAAIDTVSGDILYTPAPGQPPGAGMYPAYPRAGQQVYVRIGPAKGSDGKIYKDGQYSFAMPSATVMRHYVDRYTANLDQGGPELSGTVISVNHFRHIWRECRSTFVLGFTLGAAGIRDEIANGQFTIVGRAVLHGQPSIVVKFNVPPNREAPSHVTAERMWVNAATYLPMQDYTRWSDGQQSTFEYVFLPPTAERLAQLRPVIPVGYTRASCA